MAGAARRIFGTPAPSRALLPGSDTPWLSLTGAGWNDSGHWTLPEQLHLPWLCSEASTQKPGHCAPQKPGSARRWPFSGKQVPRPGDGYQANHSHSLPLHRLFLEMVPAISPGSTGQRSHSGAQSPKWSRVTLQAGEQHPRCTCRAEPSRGPTEETEVLGSETSQIPLRARAGVRRSQATAATRALASPESQSLSWPGLICPSRRPHWALGTLSSPCLHPKPGQRLQLLAGLGWGPRVPSSRFQSPVPFGLVCAPHPIEDGHPIGRSRPLMTSPSRPRALLVREMELGVLAEGARVSPVQGHSAMGFWAPRPPGTQCPGPQGSLAREL